MALHNDLISISNPKQNILILAGMSILPEEALSLSPARPGWINN